MSTILIIDDEEDMRSTLAILLEGEGYETTTAGNGVRALEIVKEHNVDLVVSDIRMPDMDGIELLQHIKSVRPSLPVIMVTGYGNAEVAVQSMKLGAYDYISKPFDNERLFDIVRNGLKRATLEQTGAKGGLMDQRVSEKLLTRPSTLKPAASPSGGSGTVIRTKMARRTNRALLPVLMVAGVALVGAGVFWAWTIVRWDERLLTLTTTNPAAIALRHDGLWVSDWFAQSISHYDVKHSLMSRVPAAVLSTHTYSLPGKQITGIAVGPSFLFTCDAKERRIYEHDLDSQLNIRKSLPCPGQSPSGLCWDGKYLWSSDAVSKKIYKHYHDDTLTVVNQWDSPGSHPAGIGFDGRYIWSADADTKKIYKHQPDESLRVVASYDLPADGPVRLSAFTIDGDTMWIASEGSNTVFAYPLRRF